MKRTNIEWTDLSSNPLQYRTADGKVAWACVKHSSGCANCYSEAIAERFERGKAFTRANMEGLTPFLAEEELWHILTAQKIGGKPVAGSKCFLGDMTDVFGDWVPDALLDQLFAALAMRRDVTFQILTKRADRMAEYFNTPNRRQIIAKQVMPLSNQLASAAGTHTKRLKLDDFEAAFLAPGPFRNIWLGTSCENQAAADERIPHLLATPAAVRFLSCEPLLGEVDLEQWLPSGTKTFDTSGDLMPAVDWVIVGGESGPGARPLNPSWVKDIVNQCRAASVACFVKQLGANVIDFAGAIKDTKGGDPSEWPEDLRVREFPKVGAA